MYKIPKLYEGRTVFILGGGPTLPGLLRDIDLSNVPVIGVNNAFRFPNVDVLWFADSRFYWWYKKDIDKYNGLKLTYNRHPELLGGLHYVESLNIVQGTAGSGLSDTKVKFNSSSGGSAVNVAYLLGAKRIILLGFDMRFVDGKSNWWQYDQFPKTDKGYANFIRPFYKIKEDAYKLGVEILNATPSSALDMFRFVRASEYIN